MVDPINHKIKSNYISKSIQLNQPQNPLQVRVFYVCNVLSHDELYVSYVYRNCCISSHKSAR